MANERRKRSTFYYMGKRYEATGVTQKEADQNAAIKLDKLKRGEIGISSNMRVRDWAHEWLETYKRPAIGEGQYKNYLTFIDGVILPAIGTLRLKDVKEVHLQKILNSRVGKSGSDLSKLRNTMRSMFQKACQSQLIPRNPAEHLELPAAADGTHRALTEVERRYILELAESHHAGLWIKLMLYAGLRPGETRALDWRHIDLDNEIIHVEQSMKAGEKTIGRPKSNAGVRDIPINKNLMPALQAARGGPFEPVLRQPTTGKRHTKQSMKSLWDNFKRQLDIEMGAKLYRNKITVSIVAPDLVPYCLRHTFCTDLQDAGVPINVAKYLMGHADISTTAKIYTHTTEKVIKEAGDMMNAASYGGGAGGKYRAKP